MSEQNKFVWGKIFVFITCSKQICLDKKNLGAQKIVGTLPPNAFLWLRACVKYTDHRITVHQQSWCIIDSAIRTLKLKSLRC